MIEFYCEDINIDVEDDRFKVRSVFTNDIYYVNLKLKATRLLWRCFLIEYIEPYRNLHVAVYEATATRCAHQSKY